LPTTSITIVGLEGPDKLTMQVQRPTFPGGWQIAVPIATEWLAHTFGAQRIALITAGGEGGEEAMTMMMLRNENVASGQVTAANGTVTMFVPGK
jgi:hypothetical protein